MPFLPVLQKARGDCQNPIDAALVSNQNIKIPTPQSPQDCGGFLRPSFDGNHLFDFAQLFQSNADDSIINLRTYFAPVDIIELRADKSFCAAFQQVPILMLLLVLSPQIWNRLFFDCPYAREN